LKIFNLFRRISAFFLRRKLGYFGAGSIFFGGEIHAANKVKIGRYVYIGPGLVAHAFGGFVVGDGTIIGPRLTVHTRNHRYEGTELIPYDSEYILKPVCIGKGVWIGEAVTLCPGVEVGDGAVVGAGAVVSRNIPPYSIAAGNPAQVLRQRRDVEGARRLIEQEKYYLAAKSNGKVAR